MALDSDGALTWIADVTGVVPIEIAVSDGNSETSQNWNLNVLSEAQSLTAVVTLNPPSPDNGDPVTIQVSPSNAIPPVTNVVVMVDGVEVPLDENLSAQITATGFGDCLLYTSPSPRDRG